MADIKFTEMQFLLDAMGTFWKRLPEQDQIDLMNLWSGYTQLAAQKYSTLYQQDFCKSLKDIKNTFGLLWEKYNIWNYKKFDQYPEGEYYGEAATKYEQETNPLFLNCNITTRGINDRILFPLTSELNEFANMYWQTSLSPSTDGGGGLIGYFNKDSKDLSGTIAFGWNDGRILGLIVDDNQHLTIEIGQDIIAKEETYTITGVYAASGGILQVNLYDTLDTLLDQITIHKPVDWLSVLDQNEVTTLGLEVTGAASGVNVTLNGFGVANWNTMGTIDAYNSFSSSKDGTFKIYDIGYTDVSIDPKTQSIPYLRSGIDLPTLSYTEGIDYVIVGSHIYYKELVPGPYLWAPKTFIDNESVEDNFGRLVRYRVSEKTHVTNQYLRGVAGLWHSYLFGPTIKNIESGITIIVQQPFVIKSGVVIAIQVDSPAITTALPPFTYEGGIIINIADEGDLNYFYVTIQNSQGELKKYYYRNTEVLYKNPTTNVGYKIGDTVRPYQPLAPQGYGLLTVYSAADKSTISYRFTQHLGVARNPSTKVPYIVGDAIEEYAPVTDGVRVADYLVDPNWWTYHLLKTSELDYTIQKYHSFGIKLKPLHIGPNALSLIIGNFINHIKPADSTVWFMKYDTTPLFIMGNYDHDNFVDVEIIGDQYVFLPADFIYDDTKSDFYYGEDILTDGIGVDTDPGYLSRPSISFTGPVSDIFGMLPAGTLIPGVQYGSMVFICGDSMFISGDDGKNWQRVTYGGAPATMGLGRSCDVIGSGAISFMGQTINARAILGIGEGNNIKVGVTINNEVAYLPVPLQNPNQLDISASTTPYTPAFKCELVNINKASLAGEVLLAGVRKSDNTKLALIKTNIAVQEPIVIEQTSGIFGGILFQNIPTNDNKHTIGVSIKIPYSITNLIGEIELRGWITPVSGIQVKLYDTNWNFLAPSPDIDLINCNFVKYPINFSFAPSFLPAGDYYLTIHNPDSTNIVSYRGAMMNTGRYVGEEIIMSGDFVVPSQGVEVPVPTSWAPVGNGGNESVGHKTKLGGGLESNSFVTVSVYARKFGAPPKPLKAYLLQEYNNKVHMVKSEEEHTSVGSSSIVTFTFHNFIPSVNPTVYFTTEGNLAGNRWEIGQLVHSVVDQNSTTCITVAGEPDNTFTEVGGLDTCCYINIRQITTGMATPILYLEGNLDFPDGYLSFQDLGNVDLPLPITDHIMQKISPNISLKKAKNGTTSIALYYQEEKRLVVNTSDDNGSNWITEVDTLVEKIGSKGTDAVFYDSKGYLYFYYHDPSSNKDFITGSKNYGLTWAIPVYLSESNVFSTTCYPSFEEDNRGNIYLVGLSKDSPANILTYRVYLV